MRTKNEYLLPIDLRHVTKMGGDSVAHVGEMAHAIDYDAPEGTPVYAAQDGKVLAVKDDSRLGGTDPSFEDHGNYIEILHAHEEVSEYEHLKFGSAKVRVGDAVTAGQAIGEVGNTGWSVCSHLHFMVYPHEQEYKTLEIVFQK